MERRTARESVCALVSARHPWRWGPVACRIPLCRSACPSPPFPWLTFLPQQDPLDKPTSTREWPAPRSTARAKKAPATKKSKKAPENGRRVVSREARAPLAPGHGRCARCARSADLQRGTELLVQKAPFPSALCASLRRRRKESGLRFQSAAVQGDPGGDGVVRRARCLRTRTCARSAHAASPSSRRTCRSPCAFAASAGPSRRRGRVPDGGGVTITGAQEKGKRKVRQKERGREELEQTNPRGPGKPAGRRGRG
jgi:hypothetical protein